MRRTTWPVLAMLVAASGCGVIPSGPEFSQAGFTVDARSGRLTLRNESPAPIHYVALEEETSARVDLYFDPEAWPSLGPGEVRRIPYGEIMGYEPGAKQARVFWWTDGDYRPHIVVDLR